MKFLDKLKSGLKQNASKGRKKVLKDERRLKSSRFNSRTMFTLVFWAVVVGVIFFSFQAFARTGFLNEKVNGYQAEATQKIESLNEVGFSNSPAGESYSQRFISTYINIPADPKEREERKKDLESFLAEGMKPDKLENLSEFEGKRELKSASLYDVKDVKDDSARYVYRVQYEVFKTVEKKEEVEVKKKDKDGKEKKVKEEKVVEKDESQGTKDVMLVVRLGTDGNSFNIIEQPYFKALPSETRLTAVQDEIDKSQKNSQVEEELQQFATQFFTSYTQNTVDEMSYLMEDPESLKDLYEYKGVEDFVVYDGENEGEYIVKTLVILQQSDTGLSTKHPYTLVVSKENDKFYVKEFKHTLGG